MSESIEIPSNLSGKTWLIQKYLSDFIHPLKPALTLLLLTSDYACKHINLLMQMISENENPRLFTHEDYLNWIEKFSLEYSQDACMKELRRFRHEQLLRIMLLQLSGRVSVERAMIAWSDCADALIICALNFAQRQQAKRYGMPETPHGHSAELLTLAMGKLGGCELNYSSDIDLIFAFSEEGKTDGKECIGNQQFYSKVIQQFVNLMQTVTVDGFVFRVDLRLRPNGDSGPLVTSLAAMETYYQEQGRDWERYAMVKARVVAKKSEEPPLWFKQLIVPFVYRRYVDFSVIESLRSMKAMIEREVQLNPCLNDIKRGQGGIREIEFIIQNFQLIRGGRIVQLQQQNLLAALSALKEAKLLLRSEALKQAYLFLRQLENTLQCINDQQTHTLPDDLVKQTQIILAMGFSSWDDLLSKLHQYQRIVSTIFRSVLGKVVPYEDEKRVLEHQLNSVWQGHVEETMSINLLKSLGFMKPDYCYQLIHAFRHSPRCRRLSQAARMRLDRFMVVLLLELTHFVKTNEILLQVMHLLENIVGRSAYLALLTENPQALKELLFCMENSAFITSLIVSQPFLLEVLLDDEKKWKPLSRRQLEVLLKEKLNHTQDMELQEEILRQFKLTQWLIAARAELYGYCHAEQIGRFLSDLAEVIVNQIQALAFEQLMARNPELNPIKNRFAIIAYGKLGSREMSYHSDLDLVFLHSAKPCEEALIIRLTQKILNMMTTRSQAGVLYTVDTRLRPSGLAGLLVSPVDAFVDYQMNQAWTWEHQALLKARIVTGTREIKQAFLSLKKQVLQTPRDKEQLKQEVLSMRAKIDAHQEPNPLKLSKGGLLDLEFLVQFLILSACQPEFSRITRTLGQIRQLALIGLLTKQQAILLEKAYREYHHLLHQRIIQPELNEKATLQDAVCKICESIYSVN